MKTLKETRRENAIAADLHIEKYLTFFIDGQLFTVPTSEVVEIIRMQPITYIPNTIAYVKGVINLRGKVVPVIDMRLRFQKEEVPYDTRTSIVIVEKKDMTVGLIVDSVKDVLDVSSAQISDSPKFFGRNAIGKNAVSRNFVCGMVTLSENETAMLLDIEKVLTHHSRDSVKAAEKADSAADASAKDKAQEN